MKEYIKNTKFKKRLQSIFALIIVTSTVVSGCGYTSKTILPRDIKTIYVDTVRNSMKIDDVYAYQPGMEIEISNAITRRLHRDGNLKVVERDQADAILISELISYDQQGVRFSRLENVQEFRLFIEMKVSLVHAQSGELIWKEPYFSGDADYFVSDVRSIARDDATVEAIDRLARNIVDRIVEDW